jgi:hypothetical protein
VRPHVHARTVRGASRALAMAIAFGFSRRDRGVLVRNSRIRGSPREPSPEVITMSGRRHSAPRPGQAPPASAPAACKPVLHLPSRRPSQNGRETLWPNVIGCHYPTRQPEPTDLPESAPPPRDLRTTQKEKADIRPQVRATSV